MATYICELFQFTWTSICMSCAHSSHLVTHIIHTPGTPHPFLQPTGALRLTPACAVLSRLQVFSQGKCLTIGPPLSVMGSRKVSSTIVMSYLIREGPWMRESNPRFHCYHGINFLVYYWRCYFPSLDLSFNFCKIGP